MALNDLLKSTYDVLNIDVDEEELAVSNGLYQTVLQGMNQASNERLGALDPVVIYSVKRGMAK